MSLFTKSKRPLGVVVLSLLCAICRAQTSASVSIISVPPTPALPNTSPQFTPNGPSSSFDSLGTDTSTKPTTTIIGLTEQSFPPTMTTCYIPPTGTFSNRQPLNPSLPTQPPGAECIEIIRASDHVIEVDLFTVAEDGSTVRPSGPGPVSTSGISSTSASSSGSSIGAGAIAGAVIGSVFGTLLIGATLFWIRKQRRSAKPVANWINRPAGWVQDEKEQQQSNVIEMSRRDAV